ncbi:hypothetical protein Van01_61600 [Micromonospora andamanensis]|uniref:Uncharacterized protein n=1 Tax=Micromonospora andamanensis TaxID=1287068 RepID=A0ABQ4I4X7_9ACTN|nr:hypothetical protein Van01_61600 [Micromonospora andamanensis]
MVVAFDLRKLVCYVHPVMIRHFDVTALDHDVHVTSLVRTVFDPELRSRPGDGPIRRRPVNTATPPLTAGGGWDDLPTPDSQTLTPVSPTVTPGCQDHPENFHTSYTKG